MSDTMIPQDTPQAHKGGPDAGNLSAQEALARLKEGNQRFTRGALEHTLTAPVRRLGLTQGQRPFAVVLGCADSRVVPALVFDQSLGDLFTVRVAGNVVGTEVLASIEYAVLALGVRLVVVKGHQSCGAVGAALQGNGPTDHLARLIHAIEPSVIEARHMGGDVLENAVRLNAARNARAVVQASAALKKEVAERGLVVVPAYYSLESGEVEMGDPVRV